MLKERRQRHRCGGRGRLRAGGGLSGGGQSRRRRLHDDPARRRPQDLPRLPREGAARRHGRHVPRPATATSIKGLSTTGHLAVGVPGTVVGPRTGAREVRHDEARRADRAGHRATPSRASCWSRATSTCSPPRTEDFRKDPASAAIFLNQGQPFAVGQRLVQNDLGRTLRRDRRAAAPTASTRARSARRSSPRARPARASSRRPTSTSTARASSRPSSATTAATTSSRRRRRARAAWCICEILNILEGYPLQRARLRLGAGRALPDRGHAPRLRRPQQLPRRPRLREESARAACSTRATPGKIRAAIDPKKAGVSQGHQARRRRRTKAATPRTTRSSTGRAMRSP